MEVHVRFPILALLVACGAPPEPSVDAPAPAPPVAQAPAPPPAHAAPAAPASDVITGAVAEVLPAAGYTYVRLDADGREVWAAVPATEVAVGERVGVSAGMAMADFHSDTLGRTFERIYFAPGLVRSGAGAAPEAPSAPAAPVATQAPAGATQAPAGASHSVHEVFGQRAALAGRDVTLVGTVVKFTEGVMGTNWLHLQDGTGAAGTDDLTITTDGAATVGARVEIKGRVVVDQDFGHGYQYPVMVSEATVRTL